jgi:hypothetical protein
MECKAVETQKDGESSKDKKMENLKEQNDQSKADKNILHKAESYATIFPSSAFGDYERSKSMLPKIIIPAGTIIYRAFIPNRDRLYPSKLQEIMPANRCVDTGKIGWYFGTYMLISVCMALEYNTNMLLGVFELTSDIEVYLYKYSFRDINRNRYFDTNDKLIPNVIPLPIENICHFDDKMFPLLSSIKNETPELLELRRQMQIIIRKKSFNRSLGELFLNNIDCIDFVKFINVPREGLLDRIVNSGFDLDCKFLINGKSHKSENDLYVENLMNKIF